ANKVLLRAGLHELEVALIEPGTRRTLAHRLAKLEKAVEAARERRDAVRALNESVLASVRRANPSRVDLRPLNNRMEAADGRIAEALAALDGEVGNGWSQAEALA